MKTRRFSILGAAAALTTVGTEGTYRPFTFHGNGAGDLTGWTAEW